MVFNSLTYFLFLPLVWLVFQCSPDRWRWLVLLLASIGFYASLKAPYLLVVLGVVSAVTYTIGLHLGRCIEESGRKRLLWVGISANLLVLVSLKYLPAMLSVFTIHSSPFTIHMLVTIGISYYVFQAISYLADIYLEIAEPEPHFGYLFLSLAFFPKLLQGPIERTNDILPQLKQPYRFDYDNVRSGMLLFACGLFKKVVLADRLALYVNTVYGDVHVYTGLPLILATYLYAFQIYFDFSGYTDMALGTARMFNIRLTQNFNSPYMASSVADFWRRWHISFSRWILDYIFKPLQMQWRNWKAWGSALALMVTFLVSGVWHGASWGFVIWGLLHGIYLATSVFYRPLQKQIHKQLGLEKTALLKIWQIVVTFNMICFAWIFFRASTMGDAWYVVTNILKSARGPSAGWLMLSQGWGEACILVLTGTVIAVRPMLSRSTNVLKIATEWPLWARCCLIYCFIMFILVYGKLFSPQQFLYFQF